MNDNCFLQILTLSKKTILFCFLFSFCTLYAQKLTDNDVRKALQEINSSQQDLDQSYLDLLNSYTVNLFKNSTEFKEAIKLIVKSAEENDLEVLAEVYTIVGKKMYYNAAHEDAFYYLYKANKRITEHPSKDSSFYTGFHESFGLSYYYFGRFKDARTEFVKALRSPKLSDNEKIGILNSIGLVHRDLKEYDKAVHYFSKALALAEKTNNKAWLGVLSGNIGHISYLQGDLLKADRLVMRDYVLSQQNHQLGSAINAGLLLIEIRIIQNRIGEAETILSSIEKFVHSQSYSCENYRTLYRARNLVYQAQGNYKDALESYKQAALYDDTIRSLKTEENLKKTEFQITFEQKQSELSLVQEKEKFQSQIIWLLALLCVLIISSFILIIRGVIKRRKKEHQLLALKKERVERELAHTDKEMRTILNKLMEKNQLVEQLTEEIEGFQNNPDSAFNEERSKMLARLQSITLLTDDDWLEFKRLFEQLNPNFFTKLFQAAPDLTNAEIRLVTLIKLNLSNLEMSRALGISPDSVRKTALRLRKKWNIEQQEELVKFVLSL